jgi:hypothetical protein
MMLKRTVMLCLGVAAAIHRLVTIDASICVCVCVCVCFHAVPDQSVVRPVSLHAHPLTIYYCYRSLWCEESLNNAFAAMQLN